MADTPYWQTHPGFDDKFDECVTDEDTDEFCIDVFDVKGYDMRMMALEEFGVS